MKTLTLSIPDKTYDRLEGVAMYKNVTLERLSSDILQQAQKEIWKHYGPSIEEMLVGLDYFNRHCR